MATPLWAERRFTSSCVEVINSTGQKCGAPIPKGKRKCAKHLKGLKVTQGKAVRKGSNARGIAAHKPDKSYTRRAKGQHPGGPPPGFRDPFLPPREY